MGRPPCCDKSNVKRGLWTEEEDAKILAYAANHGIGNWTLVPQKAGLNRCGKSCRLRWTNYLKPDLKNHSFTPQEEQLILDYHQAIGSRWSLIAKQLPGRADNDVKNYWNTKLKKKLSKMGIDPLTHKPFSQILSDYGKITRLPNTRNQIGSFDNSITHMSEPSLVSMELSKTTMNEQFQDKSFPNNWDNVAQFHRINQETIQPQFLIEVSSQSRVPVTPSSPSSWNEFLLGDPVLSADMDQKHEHDLQEMLSSACCEAASSSADSFVEAILDRDIEMQLEFSVLLNEYLSP